MSLFLFLKSNKSASELQNSEIKYYNVEKIDPRDRIQCQKSLAQTLFLEAHNN